MGVKKNAYKILVGIQKEIVHWEDQDVCEWITLKYISER
jgi:hypothetical protein